MLANPEVFDVIIVGASYAGLSAALTLYRATHTCLVFDSGAPRNSLARQTRLTSGWEGQNPEAMRTASRAELQESGLVEFVQRRLESAQKKMDGLFEVLDSQGARWTGRKVLFATGAQEIYPAIEGYTENYGTLIFNCMFCFGFELRGDSSAGLLATGTLAHIGHAITNARDAQKFVDTITIYTDGDEPLADKLREKLEHGLRVDQRKLRRLSKPKDSHGLVVEFDTAETEMIAFLVHKPDLQVDASLPDQLGCEYVSGLGLKVTPPFNSTNIEGVFAAGDCCSPLRNIPNAMSMGSFAGCGIARTLPARGNHRNQGFKLEGFPDKLKQDQHELNGIKCKIEATGQ